MLHRDICCPGGGGVGWGLSLTSASAEIQVVEGNFPNSKILKVMGRLCIFVFDYRFAITFFDYRSCHINAVVVLQGEEGVFQDFGGRGAGAGGFVQRPGSGGARKEVLRTTHQSASQF